MIFSVNCRKTDAVAHSTLLVVKISYNLLLSTSGFLQNQIERALSWSFLDDFMARIIKLHMIVEDIFSVHEGERLEMKLHNHEITTILPMLLYILSNENIFLCKCPQTQALPILSFQQVLYQLKTNNMASKSFHLCWVIMTLQLHVNHNW